jgi:hypothetical protein
MVVLPIFICAFTNKGYFIISNGRNGWDSSYFNVQQD